MGVAGVVGVANIYGSGRLKACITSIGNFARTTFAGPDYQFPGKGSGKTNFLVEQLRSGSSPAFAIQSSISPDSFTLHSTSAFSKIPSSTLGSFQFPAKPPHSNMR
jgi:hypothetical protein